MLMDDKSRNDGRPDRLGANLWSVVIAKALRIVWAHGGNLSPCAPRPLHITTGPRKEEENLAWSLLQGVVWRGQDAYSVSSIDLDLVLKGMYRRKEDGQELDIESAKDSEFRMYADVHGDGMYRLIAENQRPQLTKSGHWVVVLESGRATKQKGQNLQSHIVSRFQLRVYSWVDVRNSRDTSGKADTDKWWPALLTYVDAVNGRYFVRDSSGANAVEDYSRSNIRPGGDTLGLSASFPPPGIARDCDSQGRPKAFKRGKEIEKFSSEWPVGFIWGGGVSCTDPTPLYRNDTRVQIRVDDEVFKVSQIEWCQSRMVTAPLTVGGADGSSWIIAGFADGTADVWRADGPSTFPTGARYPRSHQKHAP